MVTSLFWQSRKSIPTSYSKAQDVPKSFTKDWERISLLWRWALTKALCGCFCKWWSFKKTTEAAKKKNPKKPVVLYLIPKGARFEINHNCHASVLLADRLPYALSWSLNEAWQRWGKPQQGSPHCWLGASTSCTSHSHTSLTHSPQSSGCCTSAPAQTVQPNSTQPRENKPS